VTGQHALLLRLTLLELQLLLMFLLRGRESTRPALTSVPLRCGVVDFHGTFSELVNDAVRKVHIVFLCQKR
jgi:hypothetical protein